MALYNTWAKVTPSTRDPKASSELQTGWIQLWNVPDRARNVEAVTLVGELAGEVIVVDELSLIKEEPIRVKIQAREIDKIRGFVEVFIEGIGYEIKFVPERHAIKTAVIPPPPPPPKRDAEGSDDEEEEDLLGSEEDDQRGGDRESHRDKSSELRRGGSNTSGRKHVSSSLQEVNREPTDQDPIEMYDPSSINLTYEQKELEEVAARNDHKKKSVTIAAKKSPGRGEESTEQNLIAVHCGGGEIKLISRDKWPNLQLTDKTGEQPQTKSAEQEACEFCPSQEPRLGEETEEDKEEEHAENRSITKRKEMGGGECGEITEGGSLKYGGTEGDTVKGKLKDDTDSEEWEQVTATRQKPSAKRRLYPAMAARKSSRINKKTDQRGGNPGIFSATVNSFTILNSCENDDLAEIVSKCDIVLGNSRGEINETIDAMKLEELTRATLAEANYRVILEKKLAESHALEGENLELQTVDNSQRY